MIASSYGRPSTVATVDEGLTTAQMMARDELTAAFSAFMAAMQAADAEGLDGTAIIGAHLRSTLGDEFDNLPPHVRMLL